MAKAKNQRLLTVELDKRAVIKADKSIKKIDDGYKGLMIFGEKNDYPQFMERIINSSVTAKASANIYARFIAGAGFENESINDIVVGTDPKGKKITLRRLLSQTATSLSKNQGAYIHINPTLGGKVESAFATPFKNCRFSIPDDRNYSPLILVYDNWEKDKDKGNYKKSDIQAFNVFNLNEEVIKAQVKKVGGIKKYKGQKYHLFLDDEFIYPLSTFDTVYLDCDSEAQQAIYYNNQSRNGHTKKTLARVQASTPEEEDKLSAKIVNLMGNDGDNIMVISDDLTSDAEVPGETGVVFEQLDSNINPKQFDGWDTLLANKIRKAAKGVPAILIDYEQNKLGNTSGEALMQATIFFNGIVKDDRLALEEAFKEIFSNSTNEALANNTNWKIKPFNPIEEIKNGTTDTSTTTGDQGNQN